VDVSTVDGDTSKLISGHIKSSGALFLEVKFFIVFNPYLFFMAHSGCYVIGICLNALLALVG